jgi:hypothetical protein
MVEKNYSSHTKCHPQKWLFTVTKQSREKASKIVESRSGANKSQFSKLSVKKLFITLYVSKD